MEASRTETKFISYLKAPLVVQTNLAINAADCISPGQEHIELVVSLFGE
jgi:hypothetical protein